MSDTPPPSNTSPSNPPQQAVPPVTTPAAVASAAPAAPATIQFDDFAKIELKVGTVLECTPHPNADKLLVLKVDIGSEVRQICAGIKAYYTPEQLVGKQILVVANLAPRTMRGQVSQGMLLAASDSAGTKVVFVTPSEAVAPGSKVS